MITGGTSPFPGWAIWLFIAIAISILTVILLVVVWKTRGFADRSKRHAILAILVVATIGSSIVYRFESNQRWAARAVASEVSDLFAIDPWTEREGITVRTRETDRCAQDNGATATTRVLAVSDLPGLEEVTVREFEETLQRFELGIQNLREHGFEVERALEAPTAVWIVVTASRGDQTVKVLGGPDVVVIHAAANECNSRGIRNGIVPPDRLVGLDVYNPATVCAVERTRVILACERPAG